MNDVLEHEIPASFVILGEHFERKPDGWDAMQDKLGNRCLHWGFVPSKDDYVRCLASAHCARTSPPRILRLVRGGSDALRGHSLGANAHAYAETTPDGHPFLESSEWLTAFQKEMGTLARILRNLSPQGVHI